MMSDKPWMLTEEEAGKVSGSELTWAQYLEALSLAQTRKLMERLSNCDGAREIREEDGVGGTEDYWAIPLESWKQLRRDVGAQDD